MTRKIELTEYEYTLVISALDDARKYSLLISEGWYGEDTDVWRKKQDKYESLRAKLKARETAE